MNNSIILKQEPIKLEKFHNGLKQY